MNQIAVKPIRVVIIGCGRVCRYHHKGLQDSPSFEVVGICDSTKEAATWAQEAFQTKNYGLEETQRLEADLAVICTPSGNHYQHAKAMLEMGLHVLIEKPATLNVEEMAQLVMLGKECNKKIFVVQQQRFLDSVQQLKNNIDKLGRILTVQMHLFWARPQSYFDQNAWRGTKALDGGLLYNQGAHSIDLLRWLFGKAINVQGIARKLQRDIEFEDTIACAFEFENGALGTFTSTILCPVNNFEAGLTVIAEKGIVRLGGISFEKIEVWEVQNSATQHTSQRAEDYVYKDGHQKTYKEVAKALQGQAHQAVDGEQALESLHFIEAIYKACSVTQSS